MTKAFGTANRTGSGLGTTATSVTAWTLTAGAPPVLPLALPSPAHQDWTRVHLSGWLLLAWSIVVPVYAAWTVWSWASARAGVATTNAFLYLVPVVSGITSLLFLGEGFGPLKVGGAGLVLAGLVLASRTVGVRRGSPRDLPDGFAGARRHRQHSA